MKEEVDKSRKKQWSEGEARKKEMESLLILL